MAKLQCSVLLLDVMLVYVLYFSAGNGCILLNGNECDREVLKWGYMLHYQLFIISAQQEGCHEINLNFAAVLLRRGSFITLIREDINRELWAATDGRISKKKQPGQAEPLIKIFSSFPFCEFWALSNAQRTDKPSHLLCPWNVFRQWLLMLLTDVLDLKCNREFC